MAGNDDTQPPPFALLAREAMAVALPAFAPVLPTVDCAGLAEGDAAGVPVLVYPGILSSDLTTSRLRRSLETAGFRVFGWEQGLNTGLRPGLIEACVAHLAGVAKQAGEPVVALGWSLGGLYAREIAKLRPDLVRLVVTLGSPFSGNRHGNNAWRLYEMLNDHDVEHLPIQTDLAAKPPVPTIAVWSREDGIISPASARGMLGESDETLEIDSTHMGMGTSAPAIRAVAALLLGTVTAAGKCQPAASG